MNYYVSGTDGKEYGPVPIDTLREWVAERRVNATTQLRSVETGLISPASEVPDLFPSPMAAPPMNFPPNPDPQPHPVAYYATKDESESMSPFWNVLVRTVLAIILFFFLQGLGLIFAGYAMYYAIQAKSAGNKYGVICIVIAGVGLAAVGIGWLLRMNGTRV